ncbi:MAG: J domain-containing protein [Acidimicrobiales bacterium]
MDSSLAPYEVLGVPSNATLAEVSAAYKVLAQIFHPDRFQESPEAVRLTAEDKMKELNDAYAAARKGSLVLWPLGPARPRPPEEPAQAGTGGRSSNTAWGDAQRRRAAHAAQMNEARLARERDATNGKAVARPRRDLSYRGSILYGLGMARFTGNLVCPGCDSVQWLPPEWREILDENAFFCSECDRAILARVTDSAPRVGKTD